MLRLGIIGTNWITKQFIDAAQGTGRFELTAVYSRRLAKAQEFAAQYEQEVGLFDDLHAFFSSPDFDVVYIASPNSLHAQQTLAAVNAGKHVIVEKPMVANVADFDALDAAMAAHPDVFVFEAARHIYEDNFHRVRQFVDSHEVTGATLVYMKYSSRYDAYLAGKEPNVFTTKFAGGAMMDLGVYLVYAAIGWFGVPTHATYLPTMLQSGVDGTGVMHLSYPDFDVNMICGKTTQSYLPSEIYFGKDTLRLDAPESITQMDFTTPEGTAQLAGPQEDNPMAPEAAFFGDTITSGDHAAAARQLQLARQVHQVMTDMRLAAGVKFPGDKQ
ncbi:Gfo/Idh/MocA family protein [Lacticaseibacillus thailandensis]|uniref:Dehydrogenase related protein n=1 Tax=Lacticaseibacillus thailandensis DSM 22698 = JCM 13996 TaxID=1423810 RepID=A0A0R2C8M8_9LACO|nr:Gfo/Idh/MocA family oxidoreductase [Lacticaseibacillus thailandensis]KRM87394.1 dehydrogenase related protein [Lacticaseibacillus thailandensis DSM 22698 = JCM 13996]